MCLNSATLRPHGCRQAGFLLPVAAFLLVAMGFLAASMMRATATSSIAASVEAISAQALYSAESGVQTAMGQLFFDDPDKTTGDARCQAMALSLTFNVDGLRQCQTQVSCSCTDASNGACSGASGESFYRIVSNASCGAGQARAERSVEASASLP